MQDSKIIRNVDFFVGKLACRALSWIRKPSGFRSNQSIKMTQGPQKVLMIELFEMGSAVMLAPSITYLKKQNPQVEIHALTTQSCAPIWEALGSLDPNNVHVIESGTPLNFIWSALKTIFRLRKNRFDLIIDYELFMRVPAIFSGLLKGTRRGGFYKYDYEGLYRGSFYEAKCAYNQNSHISRNYLALTKTTYENPNASPNYKGLILDTEISVTPSIKKTPVKELTDRPYIAICADVGPTLSVRNYPREHFAEVIEELLGLNPDYQVVFIGTEEDRSTAEIILSKIGQKERCKNFCGKTNFRGLLDVISGADLLITNDNGPGHFATLTGTKTLALFSTDSPYVYGPLGKTVIAYTHYQCSPCISALNHKRTPCTDNQCLKTLNPSRVVQLSQALLKGTARFGTINNEISYLT